MKGWPDYTRVTGLVENYDEFGQNYPVGIGDGAARLGSIRTYDMRGRVWWMDDFEAAVLKWNTAAGGVGGSQSLDTQYARNGNQSVRLTTATGVARRSEIWRAFPRPRKATIGLEVSIAAAANFGEIIIQVTMFDGTDQTNTMLQINEAAQRINYFDSAGAWVDTGFAWGAYDEDGLFQTFKIVQDYEMNEYVRVLYNYQELDMAGIPCRTVGFVSPSMMVVRINARGDNMNNIDCYVDDVILTIMEPK